MSWFSGLGHAISGAFKGVDKVANKINPLHHFMGEVANVAGDVWKPLGKAGHWGNDHPAEAAALAATAYYGGGALMGGAGGSSGLGMSATAGAGESSLWGSIGSTLGKEALKKGIGTMAGSSSGGSNGSGGMDLGSILGGLGSAYSGMQANGQASGLQQILNNAYGFNASRPEYTKELNALMANPEQAVTSSPGYQAKMDQALQASQRTAAAQGLTGSGTEAAALAQTGAQLESSTYDQLFQQLAMLSGATLDPSHLFSGQMSVDQTKQGGAGGVFSGLSSVFGGGSSGGSGGGLGSWLSDLFGGGGDAASGVVDNGSVNLFADAIGG